MNFDISKITSKPTVCIVLVAAAALIVVPKIMGKIRGSY